MYVKKEIFERIGLENPDKVFKIAAKNFKQKFAENAWTILSNLLMNGKALTALRAGHGDGCLGKGLKWAVCADGFNPSFIGRQADFALFIGNGSRYYQNRCPASP